MQHRYFFTFICIIMSTMIFSQDFKLQLIVPQATYILKEPILVKGIVENTSDKTLTIAYGEKGFKPGISMKRADGKQRNDCMKPIYIEYRGYSSIEAIPGWKKEINEDLSYSCKDDPGEFIVQFGVSSQGPYINYSYDSEGPPKVDEEIQAWKGALSSEPVRITIEQPQGEDKKAYDYFKEEPLSKPAELLQKFPTSTYAAYAACPPNQWTSNTDPERILKSIETGTYLSNGSVPDDAGKSKDGWLYLGGRDLIDWRAKWIGIVLKNHPDIWYVDHLKLRLAIDQIALKNCQSGESDLEKLSKEAMPEVAEKAKVYLSLMKQKGWIKTDGNNAKAKNEPAGKEK